jgi:coproporphyrinogen III oxidase-like Fe-S oxidoreductase
VQKFGASVLNSIRQTAAPLLKHSLVRFENDHYFLTEKGLLISNQVFENFTYLKSDI